MSCVKFTRYVYFQKVGLPSNVCFRQVVSARGKYRKLYTRNNSRERYSCKCIFSEVLTKEWFLRVQFPIKEEFPRDKMGFLVCGSRDYSTPSPVIKLFTARRSFFSISLYLIFLGYLELWPFLRRSRLEIFQLQLLHPTFSISTILRYCSCHSLLVTETVLTRPRSPTDFPQISFYFYGLYESSTSQPIDHKSVLTSLSLYYRNSKISNFSAVSRRTGKSAVYDDDLSSSTFKFRFPLAPRP